MKLNFFGRVFYVFGDEMQRRKAVSMLESYLFKPEIFVLLLFITAYLIVRIIAKAKKFMQLYNGAKKFSPWVYFITIIGITVLNRETGEKEIRLAFDNWFTQTGFHESNVLGFLFNVGLYIPFGYLLYKYLKTPKIWALFIVVLSSFLIETLQYVFARGVTAIDDLVANTIGGFIGILFAVLLDVVKRKWRK